MTRPKLKKFLAILCVGMMVFSIGKDALTVRADEGGDPGGAGGSGSSSEAPSSGTHGSGSYQLNEVEDDYRFYTEYFVEAKEGKNTKSAGIERRTVIHVYAKAGEYVLFGSSVSDSEINENNEWTKAVTGKDIVVTKPDGTQILADVIKPGDADTSGHVWPRGYGYIANPTQEKNGPMVNTSDEADTSGKYYVPQRFKADVSGVYTFEFHSKTGYNDGSTLAKAQPVKAKDNWNQRNTTVAAWDVTVLGKETEDVDSNWVVKEGRAWADYLALTTGEGGKTTADLDVHVLTHDGYVYKVDFKEAAPFGFIFFANNTGFMTNTGSDQDHSINVPIYHSFYDSTNDLDHMMDGENISLHKPDEADTNTEETYKIFFNRPNKDLNGVSYTQNGATVTLKTTPVTNVTISDLGFNGIGSNISRAGHGGTFSFNATDEAMVSIRLDLRRAIFESEATMDDYDGSGLVEITAPAHAGANNFYWDGKDTEGKFIPAGIYGNQNVVISTEVKHGEIHFPIIDMEGLYGGLKIERLNDSTDPSTDPNRFDLYFNNNPLAYGTIEGKDFQKTMSGGYNVLSDGTKSYNVSTTTGGWTYFKNSPNNISTLKKDDKDYLSKKLFGVSYAELSSDPADADKVKMKAIIDAEFGKEEDTYHYEAIDSSNLNNSMKFTCDGYNGGGNQAGIDTWTYYSQGVEPHVISFAVLDTVDRGIIQGNIFYDANNSSTDDLADHPLPNVKVRLIDSTGKPLTHQESLPVFDSTGHFVYKEDGTVLHEKRDVTYEAVTDSTGLYRFTGVPYSTTEDTTYYVQVMLTDVQSEALRYTCTTSEEVKNKLVLADGTTHFHNNTITTDYGADGNKLVAVSDGSKIYGQKYLRDENSNETVYDFGNADNTQAVTFSESNKHWDANGFIRMESFKKIGYCTTVPPAHQKTYKVTKDWGVDSQGLPTHQISDGIAVELWVWNDKDVKEENNVHLSRRTGALLDTQVLNAANGWTYSWENLDDRLQYYVLEYYTKKKDNGEIIYNDKQEPRMVLIGGTMPIFSEVPAAYSDGVYGFYASLGDYPELVEHTEADGSKKMRIPIQKFGDGKIHTNSITNQEKMESVENNARQYKVEYTLTKEDETTNLITLKNSQVYDDRTYYVWLNHETSLPDLIAKTFVEDGQKKSHALDLEKDSLISGSDYRIKGLSVSSMDAAVGGNTEGNATDSFYIKESGSNALFTPTSTRNYKTGTGTRTYQVKYVVDATTKEPVSVKINSAGKLVRADNGLEVEAIGSGCMLYTWFMTIHVYNVESDGVIEYDPAGGTISLQKALTHGDELSWELIRDSSNENSVVYKSDDPRKDGLLANDTYRVPLYKAATEPDMGSCADILGIAYAGEKTVSDASELKYADTYASRYGASQLEGELGDTANDGAAIAAGTGGAVTVELNTMRNMRINRTQDHANYADVLFTPKQSRSSDQEAGEDVFYYKIAVFGEDSTYMFNQYDDIDASEGVIMYTYFTMKPKQPGKPPTEPGEEELLDAVEAPWTGDETPISFLWLIFGMSTCLLGASLHVKRKYNS